MGRKNHIFKMVVFHYSCANLPIVLWIFDKAKRLLLLNCVPLSCVFTPALDIGISGDQKDTDQYYRNHIVGPVSYRGSGIHDTEGIVGEYRPKYHKYSDKCIVKR